MIKFSLSHSKILNDVENAVKKAETALHLKKVASMIESTGAKVLEVGEYNVTACHEDHEKFFGIFKLAKEELQNFYGFVKLENAVFARWIDHLEHHCDGHDGS